MIPSGVVPYIVVDHAFGPLELRFVVEQVETPHEPLSVAPHMVILSVLGEH